MAMELNAIIEEMQGCIFSLQQRVGQLDRDCRRYGIRKVAANGGVRIPKIDLLVHMGLVARPAEPSRSELERLLCKHGRQ